MLVPRSFKYSSAPVATDRSKEHTRRRSPRRSIPHDLQTRSTLSLPPRSEPLARASTEPVAIPSAKATSHAESVDLATVGDTSSQTMPRFKSATVDGRRRKSSLHDPHALPHAVAALLAVTTIPPRRPNRYRTRSKADQRISIEDLVRDWKSDETWKLSYGSPGLDVLLEDSDDCLLEGASRQDAVSEPPYLTTRSASSESMPSLEADDRSVFSIGSPSTPGSLRSHRSYQNLKRDKSRSLPAVEDCAADHPLVAQLDADEDDLILPVQKKQLNANKTRSSFKSNLTTSLQSLKNAAVNSISSLGRASSTPALSRQSAAPLDDMLWSHPFLFPRFSSEIRPATPSQPSTAERRYLNPMPLTFEEQEAPFQKALHAPYLAEAVRDAPTIQMQTYSRNRRKGARRAPNPNSEAGRALLGNDGVRQREVRENPDFLRVVVLEMNMRREGKLEQGRAKIWLPPREASTLDTSNQRVPARWIGVSAY